MNENHDWQNSSEVDPLQISGSLMVRDLSGKIFLWNSAAEQKYGWSPREAIGNVSHNILSTVFPQPLDIINHELLNRGVWKGELIHTRSDGSRVKVSSTWHLYRDADGKLCTVLEINDNFSIIEPSTAHLYSLSQIQKQLRNFFHFLGSKKIWWVIPIIFTFILFILLSILTPVSQLSTLDGEPFESNETY